MYCKNCGKEQPDGARFCGNCGCDLWDSRQRQGNQATMEKPSTYLALSIIVTILCCLPFGIVGIVYGANVDSCWREGRTDEAADNSRKARNWSMAGLIIGLVCWIAYIVLIILGVSWASWWDDSIYYTCLP